MSGTRVVLLNCLADQSTVVLRQAFELGMIADWAWLVTDGTTSLVSENYLLLWLTYTLKLSTLNNNVNAENCALKLIKSYS